MSKFAHIIFVIDRQLKAQAQMLAAAHDITLSQICRQAIRQYIEDHTTTETKGKEDQ